MPQVHILSLHGLSCMNCAKRVQTALEARADVKQAILPSPKFAKVIGTAALKDLQTTLAELGYRAELADKPDISLSLSGLHCQHCVTRLSTLLEQEPDVDIVQVSLACADIYGSAEAASLIKVVENAGYHAQSLVANNSVSSTAEQKNLKDQEAHWKTFSAAAPIIKNNTVNQATVHRDDSVELESLQLLIEGMSCASCVLKVQKVLQSINGVTKAQVNLAECSALVLGNVNPQKLINAVQQAGYHAEYIADEATRREQQQQNSLRTMRRFYLQAIIALALGIPLMLWGLLGGSMAIDTAHQPPWLIIGIVTFIIMLTAGGHFFRNAWQSLKHGGATMDTLVALGTGSAWIYSMIVNLWPQHFPSTARHLYYEASLMIIGLINLGRALETRARQHSSQALQRLLDLTPPTARLVTEQGESTIALSEVKQNMTLRLTTGDRVPVDGEILSGDIWLDEAMLTGEPMPQVKTRGDHIFAGTLVQDGSVLFRTTAIGSQTTLSRIIHLVRQAQSSKPEIGKWVDGIASVFVPIVLAIAILSGLIWYFFGPSPQIVYTLVVVTTVLIIACPCALGLATPMSIIVGVGRAAEFGVLVRDADALQRASSLTTLVFDKTGTLTKGMPQVLEVHPCSDYHTDQVLAWAAALESHSHHPLAKAILARAGDITYPEVSQFHTLAGLGIRGTIDGHSLYLGNAALLAQQNIDQQQINLPLQQMAAQGMTPIILTIDGQPAALFGLRDTLRSDSIAVIQQLRQQGYQLVMLTGDNPLTAYTIAQELGIEQVIAGVLPTEKAEAIKALQRKGEKVAMIGDGINDAPALAQADVGIAVAGGSDIALEASALTLMRPHLHSISDALALSRATLANIKQNLLGAFIYNSLGIPIAAGVLYPFTGTLLNPVVAGAAMALSSITVVINANRLLRFKPK